MKIEDRIVDRFIGDIPSLTESTTWPLVDLIPAPNSILPEQKKHIRTKDFYLDTDHTIFVECTLGRPSREEIKVNCAIEVYKIDTEQLVMECVVPDELFEGDTKVYPSFSIMGWEEGDYRLFVDCDAPNCTRVYTEFAVHLGEVPEERRPFIGDTLVNVDRQIADKLGRRRYNTLMASLIIIFAFAVVLALLFMPLSAWKWPIIVIIVIAVWIGKKRDDGEKK